MVEDVASAAPWGRALSDEAGCGDDEEWDDMSEDTFRKLLETSLVPIVEHQRDNGRKLDAVHQRVDSVERDLAVVRRVVELAEKHNDLLLGDGTGPTMPFAIKQLGERMETIEVARADEAKGREEELRAKMKAEEIDAKSRAKAKATVMIQLIATVGAVVTASFAMCSGGM